MKSRIGETHDAAHEHKLAVVIVNYKTPDLVQACLASLVPQLVDLNAKVVVVDNASGDDSLCKLQNWLSTKSSIYTEKIEINASTVNGGFSAGNNIGIRSVSAEYYLLLNSDTIVREGAISRLMECIQSDPGIGALGPQLEYLDGTPQICAFRRRGVTTELIRGAQIDAITRFFKYKDTPIQHNDASQEIDWVSFACVLLPASAIKKVGLMDSEFFMYFEDIEYCLRLKKAGYKIAQDLRASVVHLRGGTSDVKKNSKSKKRLPEYFYKSRARYFVLLGGRKKLLMANFAWVIGRVLRQLKRLAGKTPGPSIPGEWSGMWSGFMGPHNPRVHDSTKTTAVLEFQ